MRFLSTAGAIPANRQTQLADAGDMRTSVSPCPQTCVLTACWMEARSLYLDGIKRADAGGSVRECPECGAPLAKRQRRCSKCQASLRREVKRTWAQKERATVDS